MQVLYWNKLTDIEKSNSLKRCKLINNEEIVANVKQIIGNVRKYGDRALQEYTERFDKVLITNLHVTKSEIDEALRLEDKYKNAIISAIDNIRAYHTKTKPNQFSFENDGINLGKMYRPIDKVGLYIPGGSAPLVSTLLMLAVPAIVAGCKTKVLLTPPNRYGQIDRAILFAAHYLGIEHIYKVGGAQAIAAMAFGTETIPKVHKIFGPGNCYVTEAKIQVLNSDALVAIDMPAGPSEVLVIADCNSNSNFIASDLLAQAEHDPAAQVIFVTNDVNLVDKVLDDIKEQLYDLSRKDIIQSALEHSKILIVDNINQAFEVSNLYAPEHLIIHLDNAIDYLDLIDNAGSVFLGRYTPESVGDYASGPNHVLPTYGYAHMYSGLDTIHFMKAISFQSFTADALKRISTTVGNLAILENLDAHRRAVSIRLKNLK